MDENDCCQLGPEMVFLSQEKWKVLGQLGRDQGFCEGFQFNKTYIFPPNLGFTEVFFLPFLSDKSDVNIREYLMLVVGS